MIADGDHRQQKIGAHTDDRQVARALAHHQQQVFRGIEAQRRRRIAGGNRESFSGIANDATIENIDRGDPVPTMVEAPPMTSSGPSLCQLRPRSSLRYSAFR